MYTKVDLGYTIRLFTQRNTLKNSDIYNYSLEGKTEQL